MKRKRAGVNVIDEEEEEEEYKRSSSRFIDDEAMVDSDEEEEDEEEGEDDFFVDGGADLQEEHDGRSVHHGRMLPQDEEDQEDLEAVAKSIEERYGRYQEDYGDEVTDVEQQALLPSVIDSKLWLVKCAIGHERETAVCLMQKYIDKGSELQIKSVIALDHLKNYIYVEADKEAHVREACKGLRNVFGQIILVPIREMTDVLSVGSKAIDLARDAWVKMKIGTYKGDLAKVVDVDNVRQRITVKLIPRIDLQALANKLEGREVVKKNAFVPPSRFMNVNEARELHIRVEHKRDAYGERFDIIGGMMFKDGFLYKTVSMKSISAQNIKPTFDELEKFHKPGDIGDGDLGSLAASLAIRKKAHFVKGDAVIVIKGDLKNLKGLVEKVDEDYVHIRPEIKGLPKTLVLNENELCKCFDSGNHVKVVSGAHEGTSGMVVKVEQHVLILISDTTKEHVRVFADNVVECSEVSTGVARNDDACSKFSRLRTAARIPQLPRRFSQGGPPIHSGGRHRGGRGHTGLAGATVKVRQVPYKGYRGRVIEVKGTLVRVELESQMKVVTVDCNHISDNVASTPYCESRYRMGSETPIHPSQTPLRSCMTPMRNPGATPIHDGMRTPMHGRAWNPFTPLSPPRDKWEDGNPGSWGTIPLYQSRSPPMST
ncbi:hypothetical protein RIF29_42117 [Crotalaria pallida]|uniref:Transcription elongation factor SPT5 homolog 1 n=1 Tax=Crotalaria pallida TaxID=3830 RepID=A0AAN9E984_CROPI